MVYKPRIYSLCGTRIELFTIGQLATFLDRKPDTMRKWESARVLPPAIYRAPSHEPRGTRHLYSQAQVRDVHRITEEEGILQPHVRAIKGTRFVARVRALFRESAVSTMEAAERHHGHCPAHDPKCVLIGTADSAIHALLRERDDMKEPGS